MAMAHPSHEMKRDAMHPVPNGVLRPCPVTTASVLEKERLSVINNFLGASGINYSFWPRILVNVPLGRQQEITFRSSVQVRHLNRITFRFTFVLGFARMRARNHFTLTCSRLAPEMWIKHSNLDCKRFIVQYLHKKMT
ncbi:hypothetical protein CEXT_41151 [Caerostris extrusa]|uniref:Uncharacterized protein n=1 Tax=Caerostris extrusa TaxID=172846 RepID=A0AAV4QD54_CAEEX|nr:hypothetical protein CEXT_41151 [Caerostris extrusa]